MILTVSFFVPPDPPSVDFDVNVTVALPTLFAVTVVIEVPGASGCSSGGARYVTPLTVTPLEPAADQRWSFSVASCTTIFCPTPADTEVGSEVTKMGESFVGFGVGVGLREYVGRGVLLAEGEAVAVGVRLDGVGLGETSELAIDVPHAARALTTATALTQIAADRRGRDPRREKPAMVWSVPQISGQSGQAVARVLPGIGKSTLRDPSSVVSVRAGRWHSTERSGVRH